MNRIAIIGSTGMLGQPVTLALINAGFKVSLLVRDRKKARALFGPGPDLTEGNLQNIDSIRMFLKEKDFLYLNLSVEQHSGKEDFQPEREGLRNILAAAADSSIKRIGYLSSLVHLYQGMNGFSWWAFSLKADAVSLIKASGIPCSVFYPSTFMESFDKGAYRQGNFLMLAGLSEYKMYLIAGSDYGRQVARAFETDSGNQDYVIQGPEGYTADEAAAFYARTYTKTRIRILKAPLAMLWFMGRFTNRFSYGAHIIEALNRYPEQFEAAPAWERLGKPLLTFGDYIRASE